MQTQRLKGFSTRCQVSALSHPTASTSCLQTAGLAAEQESLRRKHEEVSQAYKEKSRRVLQLQELYDKVKRRAELGQIQKAASDAVDHTLQATQLDQGYAGNMTAPNNVENNHTLAFGQNHRIDISGMNTAAARNYPNVGREGTQWSRLGGSVHRESHTSLVE